MTDTAIAAALKKAGRKIEEDQLAALAVKLLQDNGKDVLRCVAPLAEAVRQRPELLVALIDYATTREAALRYLDKRVADMNGANILRGASVGPGIGGVHETRESQKSAGAPTIPAQAGGRVHSLDDSQVEYGASDKSASDGVHVPDDGHQILGPIARVPNKPRALAAMQTARRLESVFDTYKLRDGTPVGDLRYSSLERVMNESGRDAALLYMIRQSCHAPKDLNEYVRNLMPAKTMKLLIARAQEKTYAET